jgi:hypothetical protein
MDNILLKRRYKILDPSKEEALFNYFEILISNAIKYQHWEEAQLQANAWADEVCNHLGIQNPGVWKYFKRALVVRWFGKLENRRFPPNWSADDALEYARQFTNRSVRFSLFPKDIACHAESFKLPIEDTDSWQSIVESVDKSTDMEMFPEASTKDSICFRRLTTVFGEDTHYEAGIGQAMFVFEQERGQHPIITANKSLSDYTYDEILPKDTSYTISNFIKSKLQLLIKYHESYLSHQSFGLCRMLGIEQSAIEGYFDYNYPEKLIIVDMDLPFDIAFMRIKQK